MLTALITLYIIAASSLSATLAGVSYARFFEKPHHLKNTQLLGYKIICATGVLLTLLFCLYCLYLMGFVSIILAILSLFLMTIPFFYGITRVVTICIPS